jgi:TIGR03009 family protein
MSSSRRRLIFTAFCVIGSLVCTGVLRGQEPGPRQATANAAKQPTPDNRGVYGPQQQRPQQAASGTRQARAPSKLNQFMPQPRRPQASWGLLTPEQDSELELVLQAWEKKSSQVKTLICTFQMWNYFQGPNQKGNGPTRICRGEVRYAAPDKGHYQVLDEAEDPTKDPPRFLKKDAEHWVCDGNAVYEFDQRDQKLIERRLPNNLKGKAIANSPLPFVFGTTAIQMRQRYWMMVATPKELVGKDILLKIEPMFAEDRANYQQATVILDEKQMLPRALSLALPNGDYTNYRFDPPSINNPLKKLMGAFAVPATPSGWKRVIEDPPAPGGPPPRGDVQTLELRPAIKRK